MLDPPRSKQRTRYQRARGASSCGCALDATINTVSRSDAVCAMHEVHTGHRPRLAAAITATRIRWVEPQRIHLLEHAGVDAVELPRRHGVQAGGSGAAASCEPFSRIGHTLSQLAWTAHADRETYSRDTSDGGLGWHCQWLDRRMAR